MPADPTAPHTPPSRRAWLAFGLVVAILALIILPPYVSVSRFQNRITTSMSRVLGRPVHLDHVTLHLLPFPAFTIDNLVIDELPPFGDEPIIRANTVSARLRLSSLWRRRVEFSRITFTDPSINLVRNPDGRWNLESFLLQAAHINAAPTAQSRAGSTPRFPYIEATGARINLKLAQHKTPFSLTEADLALWLPEPRQWKLRLRGRPARTDTGVSDTGLLQTEATLERAGTVGQVPLTLHASWVGAPLGEASRLLTGADAGLRGDLDLTTHIAGTLNAATLQLKLKLNSVHRVDLIPDRLVDIDLQCHATATRLFHSLHDLHCVWPLSESVSAEFLHPSAAIAQLTLAGSVPDVLTPASATLGLTAEHIPAARLLTWARATTGHLAPGLQATGELNGTATWPGTDDLATAKLDLTHLTLSGGDLGSTPITFAPITLSGNFLQPGSFQGATLDLPPTTVNFGRAGAPLGPAPPVPATDSPSPTASPAAVPPASDPAAANGSPAPSQPGSPERITTSTTRGQALPLEDSTVAVAPTGGSAGSTLGGAATGQGYSAHLTGLVPLSRLLALGADVPAFGTGLELVLPTTHGVGPTRVDLSVHRLWGAAPTWTDNRDNPAAPPPNATLLTRAHHHQQR